MATGILKNGVDIDTLFLARESTKRADVNIDANGTDISNLFEPIGDGTAIANTGIQAGGVDIATLFRDINEPLAYITWGTADYFILAEGNGATVGQCGVELEGKGTTRKTTVGGVWINDSGNNWLSVEITPTTDYEMYWTKTGGSYPDGHPTENTWLPLSADKVWWFNAGSSSNTAIFNLTVRELNNAGTAQTREVTLSQQLGG